jgi:hypothetical protein
MRPWRWLRRDWSCAHANARARARAHICCGFRSTQASQQRTEGRMQPRLGRAVTTSSTTTSCNGGVCRWRGRGGCWVLPCLPVLASPCGGYAVQGLLDVQASPDPRHQPTTRAQLAPAHCCRLAQPATPRCRTRGRSCSVAVGWPTVPRSLGPATRRQGPQYLQ